MVKNSKSGIKNKLTAWGLALLFLIPWGFNAGHYIFFHHHKIHSYGSVQFNSGENHEVCQLNYYPKTKGFSTPAPSPAAVCLRTPVIVSKFDYQPIFTLNINTKRGPPCPV